MFLGTHCALPFLTCKLATLELSLRGLGLSLPKAPWEVERAGVGGPGTAIFETHRAVG